MLRRPARLLLLIALSTAACVGGKQQISAEDKARLQAQILDAVPADAKKVDPKANPNYKPGQHCANCMQYTGKAGAAAGPCNIFPGKDVAAAGWCKVWVLKPGASPG